MNTPTEAVKFNISYIKSCVRSIKNDVTKNCKKQGFYPLFESDYVVGISPDGYSFVQVWYELNGLKQCSNMAI